MYKQFKKKNLNDDLQFYWKYNIWFAFFVKKKTKRIFLKTTMLRE